jgi:hypothetical protein
MNGKGGKGSKGWSIDLDRQRSQQHWQGSPVLGMNHMYRDNTGVGSHWRWPVPAQWLGYLGKDGVKWNDQNDMEAGRAAADFDLSYINPG